MFSINAKSVAIGDIGVDGGVGTVLTSPGDIRENTLKVTPSDDTITAFKAIGKQAAVFNSIQAGDIAVEFDIMTMDLEVIQDLCGGTIAGAEPNQMWYAPIGNPPIIEKTVEAVDDQDMTWQFPRLQISAKLVGVFTPTDPNVIRVKGKVMQPTKAGVSYMGYGKKVVEEEG